MFHPKTMDEGKHLGWDTQDVIPVTGDSHIDSPFIRSPKSLTRTRHRQGTLDSDTIIFIRPRELPA
jgi:hypothetical protein